MRLAIIGGTRFIGRATARLALERGHQVSLLHRGVHASDVAGAEDVLVDRGDPSALSRELVRVAPDAVIDTRAMTRADAQATALACRIAGAPVVVLSSVDVYAQFGRLNGLPAPEPEPLVSESSPLTVPYPFRGMTDELPFDYDKKDVEAELERAIADGLPGALCLRLPGVFGEGDYRRRFGPLVDRLDRGERSLPCAGGAAWRMAHVHVRDVAHATLLAAERWRVGFSVMNVAERETPSMRERAETIARRMGVELAWEETDAPPEDLGFLARMPNDLVVSSARARQLLGFEELTTEEERVTDLIAWLRRTGPS